MKRLIIVLCILLLFAGCGKNSSTGTEKLDPTTNIAAADTKDSASTADEAVTKEGFSFVYDKTVIPMNVDAAPIVEALGEPVDYFEAASCAFQGLDKQYYYSGFELGTYPKGKQDFVSYVNIQDDTVSTDQGIALGSTLEELLAAYGEDYTQEGTSYVYKKGETKLTFIVEEDTVTQITYGAIVEGLNN
jgi:hypothetical protein